MIVRLVASLVGTVATIAAAIAIALHFWPASSKVVVAATSVSQVLFVACAAIALVCLFFVRAWLRLALAVVITATGIWVQLPNFRGDGPPIDQPLAVATSNIKLGQGNITELAALVADQRIDLLAVTELTEEAERAIAASSIPSTLRYVFGRSGPLAEGTAVYSRYPLTDTALLPGFTLNGVSATMSVPGRGAVHVFGLHPVPPLQVQTWKRELGHIESLLAAVPADRPVIALGDYNSTIDHAQFRRLLRNGYADAAQLAGVGWMPTYPTDEAYPPTVQIDHILVRGLGAAAVSAHRVTGSDHRAVVARVG